MTITLGEKDALVREALESACLRLQLFLDTFGDVGDCVTQADIDDWRALTPAAPEGQGPVASVQPMTLSDVRTDDWPAQGTHPRSIDAEAVARCIAHSLGKNFDDLPTEADPEEYTADEFREAADAALSLIRRGE